MKRIVSLVPLLLAVVLLILWQLFDSDLNYYLVSVLVIILSMLPFLIDFERSKPQAAELSLVASMIAIAVVSRGAFYLIPQVKPIGAVVIVAGASLGAKRGYFVGAMSMFISNFIFGQGIWTPFQMVALGLVGLLSGLLFSKLKAGKLPLAAAGFVLTAVLYGIIVDTCTVLVMSNSYTLSSVLTIYLSGVPFNLAFGASTAVFLFLFGEAFIKKLSRVITKYNIIEV